MDGFFKLLNDSLSSGCREENPPKKFQQYNPELAARQNPNASRANRAGGPPPRPGGPPPRPGNQFAASEQQASGAEWSRTPPQQGPNGARPSQPSGRPGQPSQNGPQNGGPWANMPPQNNGRQNAPNDQPRYGQDEMNLREAQGNPRQPAPKAKPKAKAAQSQGRRGDEDTIIGKGFTAAMKRGVAQAKPTPMHEEMVPQKDGGFIATIQKGFEGLFGKPTSKEEVLRKRGAVFANEYEAVPGDEIDQRVQFFARRLPEDVAGCLKIFRKRKGEYQINDEIVNMEQRFRQLPQGQTEKEIFAFWTTETGEQSDAEPLGLYLSHAANVAFEVKQGGNVITQVPEHIRMSFHEEKGTKLTDGSADARFNAMEVAARQAEMREKAAMAWREKQNNPEVDEEEQSKMGAQKMQDRQANAEGGSILDDALAFLRPNAAPAPAPVPPAAPPAAAPIGPPPLQPLPQQPPTAQQQQMAQQQQAFSSANAMAPFGASQAGTFYGGGSQAGTFYGVTQGPFNQQMPRQGTMYAYGSGSQAASTAGYPGMQRQGTMYAYGSAYPVPVR